MERGPRVSALRASFFILCTASSLFSASVDDAIVFQDDVTADSPWVVQREIMAVDSVDSSATVIVTGRRYAKYSPSQRVIEAKEFSGKYQDLQSVLETVSGVAVRSTGGFGHFSEASIRGSSSSQVQVNVDGIPQNGASGGSVDISKIPLSALQKIAVYKNAPPIEYFGENAGGVINLSTAPGKDATFAGMEVGSFGYRQGSALVGKTVSDLSHRFSVTYAGAANDYPYVNNNGTPYNRGDDKTKAMDNNSFSIVSSQYANAWTLSGGQKLFSQAATQVTDEGIFYFPQADSNDGSIKNTRFTLVERYEATVDSGLRVIIALNGKIDKELFQRFRPFYLYLPPVRNETSQPFAGAEGIVEKKIGTRLFLRGMVGGSYSGFRFKDYYLSASAVQPSFNRVGGKIGCEAEIILSAGLSGRIGGLYKYEVDSTNGKFYYSGFQPGGHSVSNGSPAGFSEISYRPVRDIGFLAGIRSSTRNPGFSEKFSMGATFAGNALLRPETRLEYEVGVSVNKPWISTAASLFRNVTRDKILYMMNSQHLFVPQNMDRVTGWGIENDLNLYPCRNVSVSNAVTYMENISHSGVADWDGNDEPLHPRFTDELGVRVDLWKMFAVHRAYFTSPYYLGLSNLEKVTRDIPELGCALGCRADERIELLYRLENYLNVQNYDFRDRLSPGRRHYFVVKYRM